jgi:acyl-CoA synthetase (AMP-forming)/AMP-acid ligase II
VNHSWSTLAAPVRRDPRYAGTRWLCAYPLNLYAGTQVMLQALLNWATLVVPNRLEPEAVARTLRDAGVTHAGGTPTFWRQLLLFAPREVLSACRLSQITMGGEPVNQGLLDELSALFPNTRLVHIYASTELGRLFSVTDRREGFPAGYLENPPETGVVSLRIVDNELQARSSNAMLGYDQPGGSAGGEPAGGWVATGDMVEHQGERVLFRGRKSDVINVGGRKVLPADVERVLREVPGVSDVRVYGKGSSLVGQLVAADIVITTGSDENEVRATLDRIARQRLAQHAVPRVIRIVNAVAHSRALKVVRSEEQ